MKDKTLLVICGTLQAGGAERVISTLSTSFADNFHRTIIINWVKAPVFYKLDPRIQRMDLPDMAGSDSRVVKGLRLRKYVKNTKPDIILSFLTPFSMLSLVFLYRLSIPIIVAERNDPRFIKGGKVMSFIRNCLYRNASGILCQTHSTSTYFPDSLTKKTHVIYNPIILPEHLKGNALNTTKKPRIVTIGRLHPQKNHKLLIDSFRIFHEIHPNYTLTIYGNGALCQSTKEYIAKVGLTHYIELAGACKDVQELIMDAQVFVLTSLYEGMPNALIEAMCLGLPCISTRVSGAVDLIETGHNGILVDSSIEAVAQAMSTVVENPSFADNLGRNAVLLYNQINVSIISKEWISYLDSKIT